MTNYFENCKTNEELKATYKQLAKKYHPDVYGEKGNDIFKKPRKLSTRFQQYFVVKQNEKQVFALYYGKELDILSSRVYKINYSLYNLDLTKRDLINTI